MMQKESTNGFKEHQEYEEIFGDPRLDSLVMEIREKRLVTKEMVKKTL